MQGEIRKIEKRSRRTSRNNEKVKLQQRINHLEKEIQALKQKSLKKKKSGSLLKNLDLEKISEIITLLSNPVVKELMTNFSNKKNGAQRKRRRLF